MVAVLVSAEVSVFYSKISRLSPSLPNGSTWHKHELKKTQPKQRLDKLFITKQEQKSRNKNKLGCLPTSAIV